MASSNIDPSYMEELLTCSVCLDLVENPHTLSQCLHHYCKPCVQQLQSSQTNAIPGVTCPLCRKFTAAAEIKENHFVKELLSLHVLAKGNNKDKSINCEKCEDPKNPSKANWRCVDCRSNMCHTCKILHSRFIKGHRVLELTEKTQLTIDKLLFCGTHTEEPLKFYCNQCKQLLCIICQIVTHRNHDILTIEHALQQILPQAKDCIDQIYLKQKIAEKCIAKFEKQENDLKKTFQTRKESVDAKANERIQEILLAQETLKDQIVKDEKNQMDIIHKSKRQLMDYQKEISNLRNVALASIDKAQHLSLLSELVQAGLHGKLDKMAKEKTPVCELEVHSPQVTFNDEKWNKLKRKNLLGSLDPKENKVEQMATTSTSLMKSAPRVKSKVRRVVTISEDLPESAEDKTWRCRIGGPSSQPPTFSFANLNRQTASAAPATMSQSLVSHRESNRAPTGRAKSPDWTYYDLGM